MKHFSNSTLLVSAILLFAACGGKKEQSGKAEDITQLTYRQFYELMFEDYANRVEWHEDDFNREGKDLIEIYEEANCENENCGKKVYVKNISPDQTIRIVTKTSFSIPNTTPYIANQFMISPGQEIYLACTQFCYGDETYDLAHEIVVAEFQTGD